MNNYKQEQHILFLTIMGVSLLLSAYARHQVLIYGADRFTSIITFIFSLLILYAVFLLIRKFAHEVIQLVLKQRQETVPQAPSSCSRNSVRRHGASQAFFRVLLNYS